MARAPLSTETLWSFFARTYVTEGMTGLLVQALKRVRGKDGEPVIQLKTAFGGGKNPQYAGIVSYAAWEGPC